MTNRRTPRVKLISWTEPEIAWGSESSLLTSYARVQFSGPTSRVTRDFNGKYFLIFLGY